MIKRSDFKINGVTVAPPSEFNMVMATTSTSDSDRTQDGVMHNTPMFTIAGYDITWNNLTTSQISTILKQIVGRSSFTFFCPDPMNGGWSSKSYYASNFSAAAMTLIEGQEKWNGLSINIRSINPI